eukprot:comp21651_c0_seq2/m.47931 comp21651_c0_seq2/g.47931  ORF comp21651_c0_seq2/g.47931 comp21651_c0_seq2/m.47931 type:complete len:310 (+) comp21651_c0_seq2:157-1086(+)
MELVKNRIERAHQKVDEANLELGNIRTEAVHKGTDGQIELALLVALDVCFLEEPVGPLVHECTLLCWIVDVGALDHTFEQERPIVLVAAVVRARLDHVLELRHDRKVLLEIGCQHALDHDAAQLHIVLGRHALERIGVWVLGLHERKGHMVVLQRRPVIVQKCLVGLDRDLKVVVESRMVDVVDCGAEQQRKNVHGVKVLRHVACGEEKEACLHNIGGMRGVVICIAFPVALLDGLEIRLHLGRMDPELRRQVKVLERLGGHVHKMPVGHCFLEPENVKVPRGHLLGECLVVRGLELAVRGRDRGHGLL